MINVKMSEEWVALAFQRHSFSLGAGANMMNSISEQTEVKYKAHENVDEGRRSIHTAYDREGGDIEGKKGERRERRRERENMNEMGAGKNFS